MNVSAVQNNNSQSFGMSIKLKGDSAKRLATIIEECNQEYGSKISETLKNIHGLKSEVICDGGKVFVKGPGMSVAEILESDKAPHVIVGKLYTAYDMGKELDKTAARKAYKLQSEAEKLARIEAKTKELKDLFG